MFNHSEVREMRTAETVLSIIRKRGKYHLPLTDLYRQLYNEDLYLKAYAKLHHNQGALTPGVNKETVDGMSRRKINKIIGLLRYERYRWKPVKRVEIPKKNGKTRPLGLPCWSDKLLQEVIRSLLEAYYEPQFSDHSHGFRPRRGCHTALREIKHSWYGTKWFIEGDIQACYDEISHDILINLLRKDLQDNRFVRLVENLLKAGYLENGKRYRSLNGMPQGAVVSPLLSNIYLHQLDQFVEQKLIPMYTMGSRRRANPLYGKIYYRSQVCRKHGSKAEAKKLEAHYRNLPSMDPNDPNYRRLRYVRYADDILLGFAGPKREAVQIKELLKQYLDDQLQLTLSAEKTLISHAKTEGAHFLGYDISVHQCNSKITNNRRSINGGIALRMPITFVNERSRFYMRNNKPIHRTERTHESDYDIVCRYQLEYRGCVQYYQLAENIAWLNKLHWVMQNSMLKTLAHKHKTSVNKIARKYKAVVQTPHGPRKCIEVKVNREGKKPLIARFGGIPLKPDLTAQIDQGKLVRKGTGRSEILQRLLAETCEICGSTQKIEVHHVKKLANLKPKGRKAKPGWVQLMATRQRKTLVLCRSCHHKLHAGKPLPIKAK